MAKSRHSPALYEVIDRRSDSKKTPGRLTVPKWWQAHRPVLEPASVEPPAPVLRPVPPPTEEQKSPRPVAPVTTSGDTFGRPPLFRLQGGRLELSLNPVNSAVGVGCLLLLVLASYQVGGLISSPAPTVPAATPASDIDRALSGPVRPEALEVGPTALVGTHRPTSARPAETHRTVSSAAMPAAPTSPTAALKRVPGMNYVILESFPSAHQEDAIHLQTWLAQSQNIRTTIDRSGDRLQLISIEGFDYSKPGAKEQCGRLCETVQALGKAYKKEFAGKRTVRYGMVSPGVKKF